MLRASRLRHLRRAFRVGKLPGGMVQHKSIESLPARQNNRAPEPFYARIARASYLDCI
jgi:hypothetical protein